MSENNFCIPGMEVPHGGACEMCGVLSVWSEKERKHFHPPDAFVGASTPELSLNVSQQTADTVLLMYRHRYDICASATEETQDAFRVALEELKTEVDLVRSEGYSDIPPEVLETDPNEVEEEAIQRQMDMLRDNGSYVNVSEIELRRCAIDILAGDIPF